MKNILIILTCMYLWILNSYGQGLNDLKVLQLIKRIKVCHSIVTNPSSEVKGFFCLLAVNSGVWHVYGPCSVQQMQCTGGTASKSRAAYYSGVAMWKLRSKIKNQPFHDFFFQASMQSLRSPWNIPTYFILGQLQK